MCWQDDDNFPPSSRIIQEGGNLTIVNLGKEDYGQYECVATNLVTSVITTTLLIIERKYESLATSVITTTLLIIERKYESLATTLFIIGRRYASLATTHLIIERNKSLATSLITTTVLIIKRKFKSLATNLAASFMTATALSCVMFDKNLRTVQIWCNVQMRNVQN